MTTTTVDQCVRRRLPELRALCRKHQVRRLELFGSAAVGAFNPATSDVDFVVEFEPLSPAERADAYFGLWFDLEDLFGVQVDLVEESAIRNPYFLRSIKATRQIIYAAA